MRLIGKIFSFIFAVIAVPLFALAACNVAVDASVLNRSTYDSILENEGVFEDLLTVSLPAIFGITGGDSVEFEQTGDSPIQIPELIRVLQAKPEVFDEVAALLVPPDWLQGTVTQLVDAVFEMSEGNQDVIDTELSFAEIRERFTGDEAAQAASLIISEAPNCTQTQLDEISRYIASNEGQFPICKPDDEALQGQMVAYLTTWFGVLAEHMAADSVTISELFGLSRDNARIVYLFAELDKQSMLLLYLCPAAFVSLIVMFTVRSRRGFGLWLGTIGVITGLLILVMIFGLQVAAFNIVSEVLQADDEVGQFFARLAAELIRSAFGESSANLLMQAGLFIGLGFLLLVIAWFGRRKGQMEDGDMVLITEDGQIISTASQRRIGSLNEPLEKR